MDKEPIGSKVKNLWRKVMNGSKKTILQWKKPLIILSAVSIIGVSGFMIYQGGFSYQVNLNGEDIGIIKEAETIEEAIEIVEDDMIKKYGKEAYFAKKIEVDRVRVKKEEIMDISELGERISQEIEIFKPAAIFLVDGQEEIAVDSIEKAQAILEEIKEPYIKDKEDEDIELIEVSFKQDVKIITKDVPVEEIVTRRHAMSYLGMKNDRSRTYTVSRGDTAWDISRAMNLGMGTLQEANPDKDIENLKPGEEIELLVPESLLEVISIERHKSIVDVDFETEEKEDSSIYKGEKKIKQEGEKGKKEVIRDITFANGVETNKEIVEETVIEEAKNKIVLVGTKERPRPVASPTPRATNTTNSSRGSSNSGTASNRQSAPTYNGNIGSSIVATAKHFIGTPYRYGGSTPAGFDCSGFTSYVYKQYGINIPRTSGGQASYGAYVSRSQLMPGDIVAFPGHVGIYVGGGNYIHSPQTGDSVKIASLSSRRGKFLGGRRPY